MVLTKFSANGEKIDIQEQIKKLQQVRVARIARTPTLVHSKMWTGKSWTVNEILFKVTTRYRKEFPKLKLETQGTEGEIEMLRIVEN